MINYCLGFAFNKEETSVLLIKKKKPQWQFDKLNGIGGKIELGEASVEAMVREFKEEVGIDTIDKDWRFVTIFAEEGKYRLYVFTTSDIDIEKARYITDEEPKKIEVKDLSHWDTIPNLRWLIPLCLDKKISGGYLTYKHLPGEGT